MPKCIQCSSSAFEIKPLSFFPKVKQQVVEVIVPSNVCKECNQTLMDTEQVNLLRKRASDRYRELHGLLTSKEIVAFREKLGMSQVAFAQFLSSGEASIKRWETYYVQDKSQDKLIRIMCDQPYSESNYFYLQSKYANIDIYSGLKSFSSDLFKEAEESFQHTLCGRNAQLRRLYFYLDFLHFKRHNQCITGLRYTPLKSGPSPYNYKWLMNPSNPKPSETFPKKTTLLEGQEKQTLEDVCKFFLKDNGQSLYSFSSQEKGYIETTEDQFISYKYAKDLLI